jgi:hypothetical protein
MVNHFERTSVRMLLVGSIMALTGFADYFYGPLIDARGFAFLGLVIIFMGLLLKRND